MDPAKERKNKKFHDSSKTLHKAQFHLSSSSVNLSKSQTKLKVKAINQLFLFLVWLRNGLTLHCFSWLFYISIPVASRYIITWTNFLYFKLGNAPIWLTRGQVDEYMTKSFKRAYPFTRCIIECTELIEWKVSVFGVILVRIFLHRSILSECGKIRTGITLNTDTFYAVILLETIIIVNAKGIIFALYESLLFLLAYL